MKIFKYLLYLILFFNLVFFNLVFAGQDSGEKQRLGKFSVMLGSGVTALDSWYKVVLNCNWRDGGEVVYTGEIAYTFSKDHILTNLFSPILNSMQLAGNYTFRNSWKFREHTNEFNLYIIGKFDRFPWRKYLITSLGVGEGLSYDTKVISTDRDDLEISAKEYNHLLNYLVIDLGLAMPKYPKLEFIFRYYHRCSCFHLFPKHGRAGCTGMMGGIRWYFN